MRVIRHPEVKAANVPAISTISWVEHWVAVGLRDAAANPKSERGPGWSATLCHSYGVLHLALGVRGYKDFTPNGVFSGGAGEDLEVEVGLNKFLCQLDSRLRPGRPRQ